MNIIKLTKGQKSLMKVEHPLLDGTKPMTDEELIDAWGAKDRDAMIMGHMFFIKIIVGRFLANWPETRRFEEDMISEGLLAVTQAVNDVMDNYRLESNFQSVVWTKIRVAIEKMINRDRSLFAPSNRQQWDLLRETGEPDYNYAKQLNEDLEGGLSSYDTEYIDILDELQHLAEEDRESLCTLIYNCMEHDHGILESELSQDERDAIDNITRTITEM